MIVASDLNRPVAGIGDSDAQHLGTGIQRDVAIGRHKFSGDHDAPPLRIG